MLQHVVTKNRTERPIPEGQPSSNISPHRSAPHVGQMRNTGLIKIDPAGARIDIKIVSPTASEIQNV